MENNKPLELLIRDLKNGLFDLVNRSGLPPCIITMIVDDVQREVKSFSEQYGDKVINQFFQQNIDTNVENIDVDIDAANVDVEV